MQFLRERGRLLNKLATSSWKTHWRSLIFEAVYPCWSVSFDLKSLVLNNLASLSCINSCVFVVVVEGNGNDRKWSIILLKTLFSPDSRWAVLNRSLITNRGDLKSGNEGTGEWQNDMEPWKIPWKPRRQNGGKSPKILIIRDGMTNNY